MLEPPPISPEALVSAIRAAYGLPVSSVTFLPIGADLSTAVYRADTASTAYFCKLRLGDESDLSIALPKYLQDQGIAQIIAPLETVTGELWADFAPYRLILSPFVEGKSGFEVALSEQNWAELGAAVRHIHETPLPPSLARQIMVEEFSPYWRDIVLGVFRQIETETFDDPIARKLVDYLTEKRAVIFDLLERSEQFAAVLARKPCEQVLCHADLHPGNFLISSEGRLFLVDWDYPALAPKERDLMFIGGGQGFVESTWEQEEARFYAAYGPAEVDPLLMAYYRCERNIVEIGVECPRVFSPEVGDQNRQLSYDIVTWLFLPGSSVEMAYRSLQKLGQNPKS